MIEKYIENEVEWEKYTSELNKLAFRPVHYVDNKTFPCIVVTENYEGGRGDNFYHHTIDRTSEALLLLLKYMYLNDLNSLKASKCSNT